MIDDQGQRQGWKFIGILILGTCFQLPNWHDMTSFSWLKSLYNLNPDPKPNPNSRTKLKN